MKLLTSYASQTTNLLIGLAFLPLLLGFLSADQFVLWSLFTTIAGLFLQLEVTIQATVSRNIASYSHTTRQNFERARNGSVRVYRRFALIALASLTLGGGAYLSGLQIIGHLPGWWMQWLCLCFVYFGNYFVGHNNALLVATDRLSAFSINNMLSRLANFLIAAALLWLGIGVWGLVVSFAASVLMGCFLNALAARRSNREVSEILPTSSQESNFVGVRVREVGAYAAFLALSYLVYRAILLGSASVMAVDAAALAPLALGLQLFPIMMVLSLTPVTLRVAPMMRAITDDSRSEGSAEFARLQILVNMCMFATCMAFVVFVSIFDHGTWPEVRLPSPYLAAVLSAAFIVEVNLQTMASLFVGRKDFRFVGWYALSVAIALSCAALGALLFDLNIEGMIVTVTLCQITISGSLFFRQLRVWPGISSTSYSSALWEIYHNVKRFSIVKMYN